MPLVPSLSSLQTAPGHNPHSRNVASSPGAPRRSTGTPFRSASSTQQPTPPTAAWSLSRLGWATWMSASTSCLAFLSSESVSLFGGSLSSGSSLWKHADLCHEAISADFAAPFEEIAEWIRSAWWAVPSTGICSSQDLDSHRSDLSPVHSNLHKGHALPVSGEDRSFRHGSSSIIHSNRGFALDQNLPYFWHFGIGDQFGNTISCIVASDEIGCTGLALDPHPAISHISPALT